MKIQKLFNFIKQQQGFTITELMIAITIGVILMAGIIQIYVSSKTTYSMNDELITLQENGRYITNRIADEARMAGHAGCVDSFSRGINFNSTSFSNAARDFYISPIQGFEFSSTSSPNPSLPTGANTPAINALNPVATANSDIISIQYGSSAINEITANMTSTGADIVLSNSNTLMQDINPGDMLLISDCSDAEIFIVAAESTNTLIKHTNLVKTFAQLPSGLWPTMMHYISNTYYVGTNNGVNALYVRDNISGSTAKIFEGITSIDILYGVQDLTGTRYMDANTVASANLMPNIFAVRMVFNLRSSKKVDTATSSGKIKDYIQKQFTSTIVLRNQGDW